jgi:hypothetical protein
MMRRDETRSVKSSQVEVGESPPLSICGILLLSRLNVTGRDMIRLDPTGRDMASQVEVGESSPLSIVVYLRLRSDEN